MKDGKIIKVVIATVISLNLLLGNMINIYANIESESILLQNNYIESEGKFDLEDTLLSTEDIIEDNIEKDGIDNLLSNSEIVIEERLLEESIENTGLEERVWKFTYFGPSTSASLNTINADANINNKVILNSCSYKADRSINKKGGKFVSSDPADGMGLYYTEINPAEENFYFKADVTIEYINPKPDGQEGFAMLIRDILGNHGETGSFESNLVSVAGTKLPGDGLNGSTEIKDMLGVRSYTGIDNLSTVDKTKLKVYRQGFSSTEERLKENETYRVSLEKTDNAYICSWIEILDDGSDGEVLGSHILYIPAKNPMSKSINSYQELDDPMLVQDIDKAYVGLATARGLNATFSNIYFETSPWIAQNWQPQPNSLVDPIYEILSQETTSSNNYELVFKANADGLADIYINDELIDTDMDIKANIEFKKNYIIEGNTVFRVLFKPDKSYKPSDYEELSSYEDIELSKNVSFRKIGNNKFIYVSGSGSSTNDGSSYDKALDLQSALNYAAPGQTILLKPQTYDLSLKKIVIAKGINGNEADKITLKGDGGYATFDFGKSAEGFVAEGNYWDFRFINITNSKNGFVGMQLSGSNCTVEKMNFYNNGNTGLQLSGSADDTIEKWPSYNKVINCTSMNNADAAMEDADGFAAKLTCGIGNIFDGCIAAYNADDGWDLFAKVATGAIGKVEIRNSLAYKNGYLKVVEGSTKLNWKFSDIVCDEEGNLIIAEDAFLLDAGNGNGFKMGGSNMPGGHELHNSIAYENKAKGIDSNSCPDIKIFNSTSFNNGGYNIALYTSDKTLTTNFVAEGIISFRKDTDLREQLQLQKQDENSVKSENNYYWDTNLSTSHNDIGIMVADDWFESLDTSKEPKRDITGRINMSGLLILNEKGISESKDNAGARGDIWRTGDLNENGYDNIGDNQNSGNINNTNEGNNISENKIDNNVGAETDNIKELKESSTIDINRNDMGEPQDFSIVTTLRSRSKKQDKINSLSKSDKRSFGISGIDGDWISYKDYKGKLKWQYKLRDNSLYRGWGYIRNPYIKNNQNEYAWFYFDDNADMQVGFINDNGNTYYLNEYSDGSQGAMLTGWRNISGIYYYFRENNGGPLGSLLKGTVTPDGYQVDNEGKWINK